MEFNEALQMIKERFSNVQEENHLEDNRKILKLLEEEIETHPQFRFIQALWALNIVDNRDRFSEKSEVTLKLVENRLQQRKDVVSNAKITEHNSRGV